jgi:hypothetical protein
MVEPQWLRGSAEQASTRAAVLKVAMLAARQRLMDRTDRGDRALERAQARRDEGVVPRSAADADAAWTAWIARPAGRGER